MTRSPKRLLASILVASSLAACGPLRYMRDTTPELHVSRHEYVTNNPGNRFNDDILAGRVRPGMSRLQVRVTWGDPDKAALGRIPQSTIWTYEEEDTSRGVVQYLLHFEGELLARLETQHGAPELPTDTERKQTKSDDAGLKTRDSGKKPGDPR
jgi:hypothetical protein